MNYGAIKKTDVADGSGVRVSLFVSGCRNHCPGCFQPETWNFDFGKPFTQETENEILKALEPSFISGFSCASLAIVIAGNPSGAPTFTTTSFFTSS